MLPLRSKRGHQHGPFAHECQQAPCARERIAPVGLRDRAVSAGTILLNERGEVAECTSANIFAAEGDRVWPPPLSSGCLPGVTRELLLHEIHVPGYTIEERALAPADLERAAE